MTAQEREEWEAFKADKKKKEEAADKKAAAAREAADAKAAKEGKEPVKAPAKEPDKA